MLRGSKILLRAVEPEDLDLMYLVENDSSLWQYGCSNVPYSRYALRRFIEETRNDIFQDTQLRLVMETLDGVAVGFVDLQNFDAMHDRAEVGIVVVPEAQGRGYAKEALMLLSQYAGMHLHLHLLYAVVAARNVVACRLFRCSGYEQNSLLPGWLKDGNGEYADANLFMLTL